ncbi:RagB/SusD family nutrient uptake outer membrane protein [Marinoscillum pacificum]|uniref:RagB/SusD family nutrient uptake outer membrane protein n=1 Tax=Marinoscillum pacificum TaxID=392723 RepID=UPI00215736FA|nr:RagB/SusD family nutrient uptake outer membrane protein [Marinoscillum pacificum]
MKRILIINAFLLLFAIGCGEKLELEPFQSLSTTASLSDASGMEAALAGAYDELQDVNYYGRDYVVVPEVGGDNVYVSINNSNRFLTEYNYQINQDNGFAANIWTDLYAGILKVNNIINNIDNPEDYVDGQRNRILGEALALRALYYFDLTRVFCLPYAEGNGSQLGVPVTLVSEIDEPARNTLGETYTQIESDLDEAIGFLGNATGPYSFTKDAATALKARVMLYKGEWSTADQLASSLLGSYPLTAAADLTSYWSTSGNDSEIFTVRRLSNESLGSDNLGQIYNPQGYGDIRVAQDLLDEYDAADPRLDLVYTQQGEVYNGKYLAQEGVPGLMNVKVLRSEEMVLIAAESKAKQNDFNGARSELNKLRAVRGETSVDAASLPNDQVIGEIYTEKNREFAFEGHRTFDLWRTGRSLERTQCNSGLEVEAPCSIAANSYLRVFPIPRVEIQVNQNIEQNANYGDSN